MINVNNLTRLYGEFKAVDDISFVVNEGEITGLLGPNGAGKTTTLRMLSCFLKPDQGSILVDGKNAIDEPLEIKRMIGYLPESAPLYGEMLVFDYLMFVSEIRGIAGVESIKKVAEMCRIKDVMHKSINELSKGYRQRVGLAHAMIHDPKILILDEPTSGLDPKTHKDILNMINDIHRHTGNITILVSHNMNDIANYCKKIIVLEKGKLLMQGTADEVFKHKEALSKSGLDIPPVKDLMDKLERCGLNVNTGIFNAAMAADEITDALKRG